MGPITEDTKHQLLSKSLIPLQLHTLRLQSTLRLRSLLHNSAHNDCCYASVVNASNFCQALRNVHMTPIYKRRFVVQLIIGALRFVWLWLPWLLRNRKCNLSSVRVSTTTDHHLHRHELDDEQHSCLFGIHARPLSHFFVCMCVCVFEVVWFRFEQPVRFVDIVQKKEIMCHVRQTQFYEWSGLYQRHTHANTDTSKAFE